MSSEVRLRNCWYCDTERPEEINKDNYEVWKNKYLKDGLAGENTSAKIHPNHCN